MEVLLRCAPLTTLGVMSAASASDALDPRFDAGALKALGRSILVELGAPDASAELVADHLLTAHLMGLESHGVIRIAQYARDIRSGRIKPSAVPEVISSTEGLAVVDGGGGFGQVTAIEATDWVVERARASGIAAVTTRRCNHVGRLGAYPERAARAGVMTIAVAAIPRLGHFVVPWGGSEGRFGTNPIAFGFATRGDPIVADFATSVIPEGRVRTAQNKGAEILAGAALDASGQPTQNPAAFYGPPMGALLPFGGPVGYKGSAMAMLVELLGATLLGDLPTDDDRSINGFTIIGIDQGALAKGDDVRDASTALTDYVRSSKSIDPAAPVLVPGQSEFEALRRAGADPTISLDVETWRQIRDIAVSLKIEIPHETGG